MRGSQFNPINLTAAVLISAVCWAYAESDYDRLIAKRSGKFDGIAENLSSPHSSKYGETIRALATAGDAEMLVSISKNSPNAELQIVALQALRELVKEEDFLNILHSVMHDSVNKGRFDGETLGSSQKIFNFGINILNELIGSNYQEVRLLSRPEDLTRAKEIVRSFSVESDPNEPNYSGGIQILDEEREVGSQARELPSQDMSDAINLESTDEKRNARSGAIWAYALVAVSLIGIGVVLLRSRKANPDR